MANGLCGRPGCDEPLASKKPSYCRSHRHEWEKRYAYQKTPKGRALQKRIRFRNTYGLTLAEAEEMLVAQGGVCAICRKVPKPYWVMDHDHATNQHRAVLCTTCNAVLGMAHDDPAVLRAAAEYLEAHLVQS